MNEKQNYGEEGKSGFNIRLVILAVVLLLVLVGAVWEFVFVRSAYESALSTIDEVYQAANDPLKTRATVLAKLAGKTPASEFESKEVTFQGAKKQKHSRNDVYAYVGLVPSQAKREFTVVYERIMDIGESADPKTFADSDWEFKYYYEAGNEPKTAPNAGGSVATGPKSKMERIFETALVDDFDGTVPVDQLDAKSSILKNLDLFDPNSDGTITLDEFKIGLKKYEEANGKMSEYDLVGGKSPGEGG